MDQAEERGTMGRKVVDYQLVSIYDVPNKLKEGWELYGNPMMVTYQSEYNTQYYPVQAMVQYEETTDEYLDVPY